MIGRLYDRAWCLVLNHCPGEWVGIVFPVAYCTRCGKVLEG
jgi:hypothetical protein